MPASAETQLASAREAYGYERLGPIVAYYLHDLNAVLERLSRQRGGVTLYVARGGLLIGHALDAYRQAAGFAPPDIERPLHVSRLLAAKAAWMRARPAALSLLDKELRAATAADYLRRVAPERAGEGGDERAFDSFSEFLASGHPAVAPCLQHLEDQAELFRTYLSGLMGTSQLGALVDTGWQGTILSLLSRAFPELELWGANFGRYDYSAIDPTIAPRLMGVGFDSNRYDPEKPLTALIHHRHLIEALFEPVGPSIERLVRQGDNVRAVGAELFAPDQLRPGQPAFYGGLLRYLREEAPKLSYSRLEREAAEAARLLAEEILFPDAATARLLGGQRRSVDFGSQNSAPVTLEPEAHRDLSAEQRIGRALWTQAQLALECRPAIARERQRALLPKVQPVPAVGAPAPHPKVAIIMRTMDRMIFLGRAFESVARQTFDDYVLVVFNDGGDVAGVEEELERSRLDRRKVLLLDGVRNRGMEAASNAAIRAVDSDYIVIHDDDDSWISDFLAQTVRALDADPMIGAVVTRSYQVDEEISGDGVILRRRSHYNPTLRSVQLGELILQNLYPPISFLFRRSVYEEVGGFNERLPVLGDWDFNLRFAARAEIGVIPQPLANYHMRIGGGGGTYDNSVTGAVSLHERFNAVVRSAFAMDDDHKALGGVMAMAPILAELRTTMRRLRDRTATPGAPEAFDVADLRWCMLHHGLHVGMPADQIAAAQTLEYVESHGVPTPPDFDETAYLAANPDVRAAVERGSVRSAYVHYIIAGRQQGRRRSTRATDPWVRG